MDDNPILNRSPAYEDLGPIRASTSFEPQTDRSQPSAETLRLIGELGLRYRPSVQADLEAHGAAVALLADDLAHIDPHYLEQAIRAHVLKSPFLPKACELAGEAERIRANDEMRLRHAYLPTPAAKPTEDTEFVPCTPEQADAIMREFGLKANPLDSMA